MRADPRVEPEEDVSGERFAFAGLMLMLVGLDPAISGRTMCVPREITGSSPVMTISGHKPGLSPSPALMLALMGSSPAMTLTNETLFHIRRDAKVNDPFGIGYRSAATAAALDLIDEGHAR